MFRTRSRVTRSSGTPTSQPERRRRERQRTDFRQSLARVIAAGLHDDARIDEVAYMTSVRVQLEPVHIRCLDALERFQRPD